MLKNSKNLLKFKKYFPLIIVLLGLLVYSNTFSSSFHFDDEFMLGHVASLNEKKGWLFRPRGLGYLSFAINYALHGKHVFGYHLVNLAIHLTTSVLVYFLSLLIFRTPAIRNKQLTKHKHWLSFYIALIFVVHPLQTQAVTYIVQRFSAQAALFYILGLWGYFKGRLEQRSNYYWLATIAFLLGLFTKTSVATWPLAIILCEWLFFKPKNLRSLMKTKLLLFTLIIFTPILVVLKFFREVIFAPQPTALGEIVTSSTYFLTQMRVIPKYIQLLFLPFNQNLDYYFPISQSFFEPGVFLGFCFLIAIIVIAILLIKKQPLISFAIFWFFITLAVTASFIPIRDVIFEHRLYLPMIGYAFLLVIGVYKLLAHFAVNQQQLLTRFIFLMTMVVMFYGVLTYRRNLIWKNDLTLMTDVIQKSPLKARGYNWLGLAQQNDGDLAAAKENYLRAIALNQNYQDAYNNVANIYSYEGNLEEALKNFNQALKLGGKRIIEIKLNVGLAYFNAEQYETALQHFYEVLEEDPENILALEYIRITNARLK